jgi:hypothetical protein
LVSVARSTQLAPQTLIAPLHWQAAPTQLAPEGQALPQSPQLASSVCGFTQLAPQRTSGALHIVPPVPVVDPPVPVVPPPVPPVPVVVLPVVVVVAVDEVEVEASPPQPPLIAVTMARVANRLAHKMDSGLCMEHLFKTDNDKSNAAPAALRTRRTRSQRPWIMRAMQGALLQQSRSPRNEAFRATSEKNTGHSSYHLSPRGRERRLDEPAGAARRGSLLHGD